MAKKNFIVTSSDLTGKLAGVPPTPSVVENELKEALDIAEKYTEPKKEVKPKKETAKGTISVNVMIEETLYETGKVKAFYNKKTFSKVVNDALRQYLLLE